MASTSKQLIACMSKAKGDAKKIAACKASFAESIKDTDESRVWGSYIRKGSLYKPTGQDSVVLDSLLRDKMKK
jgi:hypothetical protein